MDRNHDIPVLIAGAGPTGLMLAAELARHGVDCRIIDKAPAPSDKSKALVLHARSLEVLDAAGLVEQVIAAGHKLHGVNTVSRGRRIIHLSFDKIASRHRYALMLPQSDTERILIKHLASMGLQPERNVELTGLEQDGDGVTATLKSAAGREERCRSRWLVGCDGAHSAVRHALGISFVGVQYEEGFWLADVLLDFEEADDQLYFYLAENAGVGLLPMGNRQWRIVAMMGTAYGDTAPTLAQIQSQLDRYVPKRAKVRAASWLAHFRISRRCVSSFRLGEVFLAGDAAHVHSPAGGQGMNTGLQDAFNLGWKLGLVSDGAGRAELLASYHDERRPVALEVLRNTDMLTRVVALKNPVAAAIRNRLGPILLAQESMHRRAVGSLSELAVNYRKSPMVGEHRSRVVENLRRAGSAGVGEWYDFVRGPGPGERAPDVEMIEVAGGSAHRLYDAIRGPHFNLLLFAGVGTESGYSDLLEVAEAVRARCANHVTAHLVLSDDHEFAAPGVGVIRDPSHTLHRAYGACARCLYLIRPDGYVGYRAQPLDRAGLLANLDLIFK